MKLPFARALSAVFTMLIAVQANAEGALMRDTFVTSSSPYLNFGNLPNLNVAPGSLALLSFDLLLPAGTSASQVTKATLLLYVNRVGTAGHVEAQPVLSTWDETSATWANAPVTGGFGSGISFAVSTAQQTIAVDVTSIVKGWVTNPGSNFGLALVPSAATPNTVAYFDAKENTGTGRVARLDILLAGGPACANCNFTVGSFGLDVCARDVTPTPGACPTGYTAVGIGSIAFVSAVSCQSDAGGDTPRVKVAPLCIKN